MNILNKLTIKNLKLNKKRTIVTIIGIMLSTALICAVVGMVSSFQATLINEAISEAGKQHITVNNVKNEDLKYFVNDPNVESYYISHDLGYAYLEASENKLKPYLYLKSYTKDGFEKASFNLIDGRFPLDNQEIVLEESIIKNGKVNIGIGDTLSLNIGKRVNLNNHSEILYQINPITEEVPETIIDGVSKTYTVVGLIERVNQDIEKFNSPGYTALTYEKSFNTEDNINISLYFKKPGYTKKFESKLKKDFDYNYSLNNELLRWQMVKISNGTFTTLMMIAAVIIGIIILTSIFVIKNSFNISISEKSKLYGMFSSIGATSKQIKKNVLYEGFILGLIGIPLGILCGVFACFILVIIINYLMVDALGGLKFVMKIPLIPIILTIVLASITIYLSVIKVARKSAKISPIDAIRETKEIVINSKKLKTPKIIEKLFKTGGVIAYKNLKRSRKKYRTTVISLVVSISVFIALSTFITYGFKMTGIYYEELNYNMVVGCNGEKKEECLDTYNQILKFKNIDNYSLIKHISLYVDSDKYLSKEAKKYDDTTILDVIVLNDEEYARFVKDIGGNIDKYKTGGILIDDFFTYENDKYVSYNVYNLKKGDTFTGYTLNNDVQENVNLNVVARTDKRPMGLEKTHSSSGYLVINEELAQDIEVNYIGGLYINSKDPDALSKDLDRFKLENPNVEINYTNYEEQVKQENSMVLLIAIFLYGFITVISLIGITNIFNTITTNMKLRQKEFAMLISIGMTKKEFNRMINLESVFYGSKSLLIGIPIGLIGSYVIYLAFMSGAEFGYLVPWTSIVISIGVVFVLLLVIMHFSVKKISSQNIIETIRKDNI